MKKSRVGSGFATDCSADNADGRAKWDACVELLVNFLLVESV